MLGLVPKQISTGDRTILGRITKRGNRYLRMLFLQAARVVLIERARISMMARSDLLHARAGYRSARPTNYSEDSACNARPVHTNGPFSDACGAAKCPYLIISSVVARNVLDRQPRGLSFATRNFIEVFFILCSREQIAFSLDASTVLRG